jgi:hypothetical protein
MSHPVPPRSTWRVPAASMALAVVLALALAVFFSRL